MSLQLIVRDLYRLRVGWTVDYEKQARMDC
jgi:hypothetical protein